MKWDVLRISRLIACVLLLLAIAKLPYDYYRFLRIAVTIIAGINAFVVFKEKNKVLFIVFVAIAILFNPIIPVYLSKKVWIPIDLLIGLFFGVTAFIKTNNKKDKNDT